MSECQLNHSYADVVNKLESQKDFLPEALYAKVQYYLQEEGTQDLLNELFHLLKKYDLASSEEQEVRNNRLTMIVDN